MKNIIFNSAFLSCFLLFCCSCSDVSQKNEVKQSLENTNKQNIKLKFNSEGKFKIVQLTDIHWKNKSDKCDSTLSILGSVLDVEKPDLVVFTGDIATSDNQKVAYDRVSKLVIDRKIPWAFIIGNHDHEHDMKRKDIIPYLQKKPYFLGCNGPDDVFGYGNYVLPILSSKGNTSAAQLYFFDSNAYVKDKAYGYYDWIRFSQIKWYREQSEKLKKLNGGKVLPSLAFFHIPLPEYNEVYNTGNVMGEKNESVCSSEVNSGLFSSLIEMGDVMGVFVGHDHDNDYIGVLRNIALAYGGVSGLDAYGSFDRGGRVIELYEGKRKFDSWIRTLKGKQLVYHYPHNDLYPTDSTVYLPSIELKSPQKGVNFKYYEGQFLSAKDILSESPKKSGTLKNFSIDGAEVEQNFGFDFNSYISIPEKAIYKITTTSDDGTILWLDDKEIINDDGSHSEHEKTAAVALDKGFHKVNVLFFNGMGGSKFKLGITSLNMQFDMIPDFLLYY